MEMMELTADAGLMRVVCAWCGRDLGQKMGPTGAVSHGICAKCKDNVQASYDQQMLLSRIAGAIYDAARSSYSIDHWPMAVDAADAVLRVLDEIGMLLGTGQTSVEEGIQHRTELKLRGPLAVGLVEDGE